MNERMSEASPQVSGSSAAQLSARPQPDGTLEARSPQGAWLARIDAGLLVVLSLPWMILRFDRTWLFAYSASSYGFIDPWVYFGYFLDLTQHLRTFKGAYFTTRLSWILPGAAVYHIFPPLVAPYVLHLALFYAATVSLYLILKHTASTRAAFLGALLMGCHAYFLRSMGWDYVDGAAIAYMLMTLCALTCAAKSARPRPWLVAVGVLSALTLYAQLFLIVFSPLALGYYQFARREHRRDPVVAGWKPFAWGFTGVTAILGTFNMVVNGRFFFFVNSMGMAAKLVVNHNPYNDSTLRWLAQASWLVLPLLGLVGAILCLRQRRDILSIPNAGFLLFWQRYLVLSVSMMVLWELIRQPVLQLSFYASYLIPASFLALASQMETVLRNLSRRQFLLLSGCALFLSLLPFWIPVQSQLMWELQGHPLLFPILAGITAVVLSRRQIRHAVTLGVLLLCISLGILTATSSTRTWGRPGRADDPAFQEQAFLTIVDSVRTIQELDPKANLFFWYDGHGRLGRLYRSVASTFGWSYRLQSESFPEVGPKAPPLGRRIVILSEDAKVDLGKAEGSLHKLGLGAQVVAQRTIHEGPFNWSMTEIELTSQSMASDSSRGSGY
jgi:hypothetical protein